MTEPSLTTLIGDEIQGNQQNRKWATFVDGGDGFFYGIPYDMMLAVWSSLIPSTNQWKRLDLISGEGRAKWMCSVRANTGSIYYAPFSSNHILKINTNDGTVETLDDVELPETGEAGDGLWASGALAPDNNIYYMPYYARRIMKLNADNDTCSSVGDNLGGGYYKYKGTVVGNDDCMYGIPHGTRRIAKFDTTNPDTPSTVEAEAERRSERGNGVLGGDGYIYAANGVGQVLQIDSTHNNYMYLDRGSNLFRNRR